MDRMLRESIPARAAGGRNSDRETAARPDDHRALRLWLRLLTCTQLIERNIRNELRTRFGTTLPRFDLMSQLERHPEGLKMNELSRRMMVSGGNVTGITDQLVGEGLVERLAEPSDRRAFRVRLTQDGDRAFAEMAREHEAWMRPSTSTRSRPKSCSARTARSRRSCRSCATARTASSRNA